MISLVRLSLCDSKSAGDTIDQLAISGKFVDFFRQRRQDVTTVRSGLGFYVWYKISCYLERKTLSDYVDISTLMAAVNWPWCRAT